MELPPDLIGSVLNLPTQAMAYHAGRRLREMLPGKAVLECAACGFDLDGFMDAGHATLEPVADLGYSQIITAWRGCSPDPMGGVCATGETGLALKLGNAFIHLHWQD